ncbi:hypothetical protein GCM10008924_00130 [Gracilibacillus halotolerans]
MEFAFAFYLICIKDFAMLLGGFFGSCFPNQKQVPQLCGTCSLIILRIWLD